MQKNTLKPWNWGAFFLSWIWGLGNGSYIGLSIFMVVIVVTTVKATILNYVPFLNFPWVMQALNVLIILYIVFMQIVYGLFGNKWAWNNRKWRSQKHFRTIQRIWGILGLCIWIVLGSVFFSIQHTVNNNQLLQRAFNIAKTHPILEMYLGSPINISLWSLRGGFSHGKNDNGSADFKFTAKGLWQTAVVIVDAQKTDGNWTILQETAIIPNLDGKPGNMHVLLYGKKGYLTYRS